MTENEIQRELARYLDHDIMLGNVRLDEIKYPIREVIAPESAYVRKYVRERNREYFTKDKYGDIV